MLESTGSPPAPPACAVSGTQKQLRQGQPLCCFWLLFFCVRRGAQLGESWGFRVGKILIPARSGQKPLVTSRFPPKSAQRCYMSSCKL